MFILIYSPFSHLWEQLKHPIFSFTHTLNLIETNEGDTLLFVWSYNDTQKQTQTKPNIREKNIEYTFSFFLIPCYSSYFFFC